MRWDTESVAEALPTYGFPPLTRSRHHLGFPSSCTARHRKPPPRCAGPFLAHGKGGTPRRRSARPPQPRYGRQGLMLSLIRPHGCPTMHV